MQKTSNNWDCSKQYMILTYLQLATTYRSHKQKTNCTT